MEEGTKSKKTIFVGGISDDTDETTLYEAFYTFGMLLLHFHTFFIFIYLFLTGDIIEVQLPPPATQHLQNPNPNGRCMMTVGPRIDFYAYMRTPHNSSRPQTSRIRIRHFFFIRRRSRCD